MDPVVEEKLVHPAFPPCIYISVYRGKMHIASNDALFLSSLWLLML